MSWNDWNPLYLKPCAISDDAYDSLVRRSYLYHVDDNDDSRVSCLPFQIGRISCGRCWMEGPGTRHELYAQQENDSGRARHSQRTMTSGTMDSEMNQIRLHAAIAIEHWSGGEKGSVCGGQR